MGGILYRRLASLSRSVLLACRAVEKWSSTVSRAVAAAWPVGRDREPEQEAKGRHKCCQGQPAEARRTEFFNDVSLLSILNEQRLVLQQRASHRHFAPACPHVCDRIKEQLPKGTQNLLNEINHEARIDYRSCSLPCCLCPGQGR